jgi:hypothetical protein
MARTGKIVHSVRTGAAEEWNTQISFGAYTLWVHKCMLAHVSRFSKMKVGGCAQNQKVLRVSFETLALLQVIK